MYCVPLACINTPDHLNHASGIRDTSGSNKYHTAERSPGPRGRHSPALEYTNMNTRRKTENLTTIGKETVEARECQWTRRSWSPGSKSCITTTRLLQNSHTLETSLSSQPSIREWVLSRWQFGAAFILLIGFVRKIIFVKNNHTCASSL